MLNPVQCGRLMARGIGLGLATIGLLAAVGCTSAMAPSGGISANSKIVLGGDACGASALQHLVGEEFATVRHAGHLQDAQVQTHVSAVTLEFEPHRLNVVLDSGGRVAAIGCF